MGVEVEPRSGFRVGKRGARVQKQDQACALAAVRRRGARAEEALGLGEKVIREGGAIVWQRPRHGTAPRTTGQFVFRDDALTIGRPRSSTTLQLFVKRTPKHRSVRNKKDLPSLTVEH